MGSNFRRHLSSAFLFLRNCRLKRSLYAKLKDWMSNSVDPDEPAHLDLCCLQKPIMFACGSERVKTSFSRAKPRPYSWCTSKLQRFISGPRRGPLPHQVRYDSELLSPDETSQWITVTMMNQSKGLNYHLKGHRKINNTTRRGKIKEWSSVINHNWVNNHAVAAAYPCCNLSFCSDSQSFLIVPKYQSCQQCFCIYRFLQR